MSEYFPVIVDPERIAQLMAHRACIGVEHDPANGKLHGYCVVCGVPWPCDYAGKPPAATQEPAGSKHVDILAELDREKYTGPMGKIMQAREPAGSGMDGIDPSHDWRNIIGLLKSTIGMCSDEEPHQAISANLWHAVHMIYVLYGGSPRKVGEDGGCLCFDTGCDLRGYCLNPQCDEWKQASAIARRFHEAYERLAPDFGYETRRDSAVHWDHLPEKNRKLMLATCATLLRTSGVLRSVPVGEQKQEEGV